MTFEMTILGCNSAIPAHGRFPTSQVLNVCDQLYLIDCGEGTQVRLQEYKFRKSKINAIFISHLHGDHIFGLMGLLNSMGLAGRLDPLHIFAPFGLEPIVEVHFKYMDSGLPYPLNIHVVDTEVSRQVFEDQLIEVRTIPLKHRIPACGYLFKEKENALLNILPDKIKQYQIPIDQIRAIKAGADFTLESGEVIPNEELTLPPYRPRSFAFCSDTMYDERIVPVIDQVDLLYHETTFLHKESDLARETMHSTALQAANIAKKARVGKLVTGHYSSRYKDLDVFADEAKTVFPETVLGLEGKTYGIEKTRMV